MSNEAQVNQDNSSSTNNNEAASTNSGDDLVARKVAVELLTAVLQRKQALDHSLEASTDFKSLQQRDRNFCRMLTATTLRRLGQIDALIEKAAERPQRISPMLHQILRIGTAQILFMAVADHGAVDSSVRLCEDIGMTKHKGFINAMLRTITREGKDWLSKQDETRLNTPPWLLEMWIKDYGLRTAANIAQANLTEAPLDISLKDLDAQQEWAIKLGSAKPIGKASLRREAGGNITQLAGYDEGQWWIQDASAAIPAYLFGNIKGKTIIDMCAAPGGKTMQLAAQGAQVIALDRSAKRLAKLRENAKRMQLDHAINIQVADACAWNPKEAPHFILLDVPCSATGTIRRNPDLVHLKSQRDVQHLQRVQQDMLRHAFDILAPGGIIIYCTCSLQKAEGEHQIKTFLSQTSAANKIAITAQETGDLTESLTENGDMRILPHHNANQGGMDGFFISRITKH